MATPIASALAVSAGCFAAIFALILLATRRTSVSGRALATVLLVESALHMGAGLPLLLDFAGRESMARALDVVFLAALMAALPAYLLLLRELPSRFVGWLRRPGATRWIWATLAAVASVGVVVAATRPATAFIVGVLSMVIVSGFALAVSLDARRRTRRGSALRARADAFLVAFGVRDSSYVAAAGLSGLALAPGLETIIAAAGTLLYVPLLLIGIARTDLFHLAPRPAPLTSLPARFTDGRPVGESTWIARDVKTGSTVVVKDVGSRSSPAVAAGRTGHANLATLLDVVESPTACFAVFAHVEGSTWRETLKGKRSDPKQTVGVLRQLLAGLATLHRAGFVHADVTPANIVLHGPSAVLIDLGGCRRLGDPGADAGTPRYMSPEQASGEPCTGASDVYALGLCAWECLVGEPYLGRVPDAMDGRIRAAYPGPYRSHPATARLDAWLVRALAPDVSDRFADAVDARGALPQPS